MNDTPRTDSQPWIARTNGITTAVSADFARELERENAKLLADKARLDWLEENNGLLKFEAEDEASLPHAAVYLPTFKDGQSTWRHAASGDDFREAIDAAMAAK